MAMQWPSVILHTIVALMCPLYMSKHSFLPILCLYKEEILMKVRLTQFGHTYCSRIAILGYVCFSSMANYLSGRSSKAKSGDTMED